MSKYMSCRFVTAALVFTALAASVPAQPATQTTAPSFAKEPAVAKGKDGAIISFALAAPGDVEVAILNQQGKIVRHLVAGVVGGSNPPPAPLRPGKEQLPPGLKGKLAEGEKDPDAVAGVNLYPLIYGSVVKFGPEGGQIRKDDGGVECNYNNRGLITHVKGAKWIVPEASNVPSWRTGDNFNPDICLCESPRFDVDGFGRSFYPDAGRFRVGVLDTAGNAICTFGGYGNQDSAGAGSAVPVPAIPFCWVQCVAVGDEAAYVGDRLNRRVVRVKLEHAAAATCPIPK